MHKALGRGRSLPLDGTPPPKRRALDEPSRQTLGFGTTNHDDSALQSSTSTSNQGQAPVESASTSTSKTQDKASKSKKLCKDCQKEDHNSSASPRCDLYTWQFGAPPMAPPGHYMALKRATHKDNFPNLVKNTFTIGDAVYQRDTFINYINETTKKLSSHMAEFSQFLYAFCEHQPNSLDSNFCSMEVLKPMFYTLLGRLPGSRSKSNDNSAFKEFTKGYSEKRSRYWQSKGEEGSKFLTRDKNTSELEHALLKKLSVNIKVHLSKTLKFAYGKYLYTLMHSEGVSKKSSRAAKRELLVELDDLIGTVKYSDVDDGDEEGEDTAAGNGLQADVCVNSSNVTESTPRSEEISKKRKKQKKQKKKVQNDDDHDDDDDGIVKEIKYFPPAPITERQRPYISSNVPPNKLYKRSGATRYEKNETHRSKRRWKRRQRREDLGALPGERPSGGPIRSEVAYNFNTTRTVRDPKEKMYIKSLRATGESANRIYTSLEPDQITAKVKQFIKDHVKVRKRTSMGDRLKEFSKINQFLQSHKILPYKVIPIFSLHVKHITLNYTTLPPLLRSCPHEGDLPSQASLHNNMLSVFYNIFNLTPALRSTASKTVSANYPLSDYTYKQQFLNSIQTDGKNCSVSTGTFVLRKSDFVYCKEVWIQCMKDKQKRLIQSCGNSDSFIGIDPGRKDLITCARRGMDKPFSVSAEHWANVSHRHRNTRKAVTYLRQDGVYGWITGLPKSGASRLEYLYAPNSKLSESIVAYNTLKYKRLTLRGHIGKQRGLKHILKGFLQWSGYYNNRCVAVGFGNATFRQNTRGYVAGGFIREFKRALEDYVKVINIDEYHTSQVCNNCLHNHRRIVKLPSSQSWHLKLCKVCCQFYNRDMNAAKNMLYILLALIQNSNICSAFKHRFGKLPTQ